MKIIRHTLPTLRGSGRIFSGWTQWFGSFLLLGWLAQVEAQLTVSNGLALWLKADAGITTNAAGNVTAWLDQSPSGNNAGKRSDGTDAELPSWIGSAVQGKPAVRFDGVTNVLEIANSATLQPQSGDWTVFFVAKRGTKSQGDFPEVIGSRPWVAGLDKGWAVSFDGTGLVCSHLADGSSGHDVPGVRSLSALSQSTFQMWQVEENRAGGRTTFYKNGDVDVVRAPAMPGGAVDQTDSVFIGREIGGANNRRANMDLAEVLVYDRVLPKTERDAVAMYLSDRYGLGFTPAVPPSVSITIPANGTSYSVPASFVVSATAVAASTNDHLQKVEFYADNGLVATATAPPYSVPLKVQSTGTVTLTAVATDNRSGASTSAPVVVTITGSVPAAPMTVSNGLQLWLEADAGVTADASGAVSAWSDQSGHGNNAVQDNARATPPESFQPTLIPSAANGKPAVHFDGVADFMLIANSPSLQPQLGDWTVLFVAQRGTPSRGDFPQIIGSRPWTAGADLGWAVCFDANGFVASHFADGALGHDVPAVLAASPLSTTAFQVWQVEENRGKGSTTFYVLGQTNKSMSTPMPTNTINQPNDIILGREVEGGDSRRANIQLAELLVYNRALPDADRNAATAYLLQKYGIKQISTADTPPTITLAGVTNGSVLSAPAAVTLTANAVDSDGSIVQVEFFSSGRSLGVSTNAPYKLAATITSLGDQSVTAVATDNLGLQTVSEGVPIRVIAPNIQLIGKLDYSDTFSTNGVRTDRLYNNNTNGAYNVEDTHGNAPATWTPSSNFSFNTPGSSTDAAKLQAAQGNPGANTGFAQSGGGDFSIAYALQSNYVVQVDAILPNDRLDITSLPTAGGGIFATDSLSVFLRRDTVSGVPFIGLFNGAKETAVTNLTGAPVRTGVADNNWHNFAVHFDRPDNVLQVYVDGVLLVTLDLAKFAGGLYQNYSNGAVGVGGAGSVLWVDNFKLGAPPQLVTVVDYSDTFTTNSVRTDGLYNDNTQGAYNVENTRGNPAATWTPISNFSFVTPASSTDPGRLTAAGGNAGANSGLAQSGGGDFSFAYGLRNDFVVQMDAILPTDRLDITSLDTPGGGIFGANKLSVFLRRDSTAGTAHPAFPDTGLPAIGLYNGSKETGVFDASGKFIYLGVDDDNWHRYAVRFDQPDNTVSVYVDSRLITTVDLTSFAGGIYKNYSSAAVGMGGAGGVFWMDNFIVGGSAPSGGPPGLLLHVTRQQNNLTISWTGAGTLEHAPSVTGPWTAVAGAANPYATQALGQQQFYRLRQ